MTDFLDRFSELFTGRGICARHQLTVAACAKRSRKKHPGGSAKKSPAEAGRSHREETPRKGRAVDRATSVKCNLRAAAGQLGVWGNRHNPLIQKRREMGDLGARALSRYAFPQPSKLRMRVRFPLPAPITFDFSREICLHPQRAPQSYFCDHISVYQAGSVSLCRAGSALDGLGARRSIGDRTFPPRVVECFGPSPND
jgi:hypothetical protein